MGKFRDWISGGPVQNRSNLAGSASEAIEQIENGWATVEDVEPLLLLHLFDINVAAAMVAQSRLRERALMGMALMAASWGLASVLRWAQMCRDHRAVADIYYQVHMAVSSEALISADGLRSAVTQALSLWADPELLEAFRVLGGDWSSSMDELMEVSAAM